MGRLVLAVIVASLLAMPTSADAYTREQLNRWSSVADRVWPDSHCAGRYQPRVVARYELGTDGDNEVVGRAALADPACVYDIADGLEEYEACLVVVHEAGHLAGYRATDPAVDEHGEPDYLHDRAKTIMHPVVTKAGAFRPCLDATPPTLTRMAARNWVEARWGLHLNSLDCRRDRIASRQRCWGRTVSGKRARWVVWRDGQHRVRGGRTR